MILTRGVATRRRCLGMIQLAVIPRPVFGRHNGGVIPRPVSGRGICLSTAQAGTRRKSRSLAAPRSRSGRSLGMTQWGTVIPRPVLGRGICLSTAARRDAAEKQIPRCPRSLAPAGPAGAGARAPLGMTQWGLSSRGRCSAEGSACELDPPECGGKADPSLPLALLGRSPRGPAPAGRGAGARDDIAGGRGFCLRGRTPQEGVLAPGSADSRAGGLARRWT